MSRRCAATSSVTDALTNAYGARVSSLVAVITTMVEQIGVLEAEVSRCFGQHPDAEIITSEPGLGVVLGARVLAEFGDDKDRFVDAKARRNYAGTSPITKTSGTGGSCSPATPATNGWPTPCTSKPSPLSAPRPAPGLNDNHRATGATHHQALRALSNCLVGILEGCIR